MATTDTETVYKQLKKQNGERVARVIRDAVLLDVPNIVHILEFAGNNPDEVHQLIPIIREIYKTQQESKFHTDKTPLELLSDAGYDAFVVTDEAQKNSIKQYYRPNEEICTFRDPKRHINYYMIHAVKRGADKIEPSKNPQREDEYGTSVISIQIAKSGGFISIKNRYNHTIPDPDNTFNSNPDNIIPGLSDSLKKFFNVEFNTSGAKIPQNFRIVNDQLVRYDYELNNIYFGSDYYFSGSTITKLNNDNQILFFDGFVLTMSKGDSRIESIANEHLEFCDGLNEIMKDKKVAITVAKDKTKSILVDGKRILDVKNGVITFLNTPNIEAINCNRGRMQLSGNVDFSGVKRLGLKRADLSEVTNIKLNPRALRIVLHDTTLAGDLDFSHVDHLELIDVTLDKNVNIKFNPSAFEINLSDQSPHTKLHGDLDFTKVNFLKLGNIDLSNVTSIKFYPHASRIIAGDGGGLKLSGDLDFSDVRTLELLNADCSNVTDIKFNPKAEKIAIGHGLKLSGDLDFSGVSSLNLSGADLSKVSNLKIKPTAYRIILSNTKLSGYMDFSNIEDLDLSNADLTNVTDIKFNSKAHTLKLNNTKLSGRLDFGEVQELELNDADLNDVTDIKFNPKASTLRLRNTKLMGDLDFATITHPDLSGADVSNVKSIRLGSFPLISGIKSINPIKLEFTMASSPYNQTDLSGLKDVTVITPKGSFELKKLTLGGTWDFSSQKFIYAIESDLSKAVHMKFAPGTKQFQVEDSKLAGDLDFSNVDKLILRNCDLTGLKSIRFNPKGKVFLWRSKFSGDLDFGDKDYLALMETDFTNVKSIKLSNKLYRAIKYQDVVLNGEKVLIKDLHKHGTKIIRPNIFKTAKEKLQKIIPGNTERLNTTNQHPER